ncbi:hypothetical protein [Xenorhabdus innexi]|uniref:Uncharacterized protein n=1 Tax=Xenorhabdus innexi TaxID=290109 RepID=A0A1N6MXZ2_9GAMM|nr:hypothetical protein [Xenorhabdus innexi]PHM29997.1 hypothetical protein Xinn_03633 [Xenorhabdus innexi]SIP73589.1 hypothetical protein XIS1_40003 [Xenorhabdus innexi]
MKAKTQHNDQHENIYGLDKFRIEPVLKSKTGPIQLKVFANGKMQVGVVVVIQAKDDNDNIVTLSEDQLKSIKLINYDTGDVLSDEWTYDTVKNEYYHTFPGEPSSQIFDSLDEEQKNHTIQKQIYWVSTSNPEPMEIGAQVTLNNKQYNTLIGSSFKSSVIILGYPPILYNSDNLIIEEQKDIKKGKYKATRVDVSKWFPTRKKTEYLEWSQTNYYIKPKNGNAIKNACVWNTSHDCGRSNVQYRRFSYLTKHYNLYLFFLWGTYQKKNKLTGYPDVTTTIHTDNWLGTDSTFTASPQVHLDILNPGTGVVSVTKLYFKPPYADIWGFEFSFKPYFYFHDVYGNKSNNIRIIMNEDNQSFHLIDANND